MIFCNRKTDVDTVAKALKKAGYDAAPIHGDLDQSQRTRTLNEFREQTLKYLVCSDVLHEASISPTSAMCSTSTSPVTRRITSTG